MKKEELVKAAKELDKLLFENPQIDFTQGPEKLEDSLMEASKELELDDELSKETIEALSELWEGKDGKLTVKVSEIFRELNILLPVDEKQDEPEDAQEVQEGNDLINEVEDAERLKDLKDIAKSNDEFKEIRGKLSGYKDADDLRGAMLEILDETPEETKPEKASKEKAAEPEYVQKMNKKKEESKVKMEVVKGGKKEEKSNAKKTEFGHKVGSQAAIIDAVFLKYVGKNVALATIVEQTNLSESRIKSHVYHLIKKRKLSIDIESSNKGTVYKFTK